MTHVLVVHHDLDMADQEADWLRRAGFTVSQCAGPAHGPCPILRGLHCQAVEEADVLVYDIWASGDTATERDLIERLRELHPEIPIVLTAPGMEFDWVETVGVHAVTPIVGPQSSDALQMAVERARL